jgi:transcriptional regulator with XRE-family HTH domain
MLYKKYLRNRLQTQAAKNSIPDGIKNASQVAAELGIEPSYLSRFLGEGPTHFSDDLLYRFTQLLGFSQSEVDHLWLLRDYDRTSHPDRRAHLETRIRAERLNRFSPELDRLQSQLQNLMGLIQSRGSDS